MALIEFEIKRLQNERHRCQAYTVDSNAISITDTHALPVIFGLTSTLPASGSFEITR